MRWPETTSASAVAKAAEALVWEVAYEAGSPGVPGVLEMSRAALTLAVSHFDLLTGARCEQSHEDLRRAARKLLVSASESSSTRKLVTSSGRAAFEAEVNAHLGQGWGVVPGTTHSGGVPPETEEGSGWVPFFSVVLVWVGDPFGVR